MDKYLTKRKPVLEESSVINTSDTQLCAKKGHVELNLNDLSSYPRLKKTKIGLSS